MRCRRCNKKAVIKIKAYNNAFCPDCFTKFFTERVRRTISKYKLIKQGEKILVAISGGKDSLTIWEILNNLGYSTDGVFVDLGIDEYSHRAETKVMNFADLKGLSFESLRISEILGNGIKEIARITRRPTCSICGLVKRYLLNQYGLKGNYDILITGHNLDDETATLLGNIINWQIGYLSRQAPRLDRYGNLVARAKPLAFISERESAAYAFINNIDYQEEDCPYSKGASSILYKNVLNEIEFNQPASKLQFFKGFLKSRHHWDSNLETDIMPCSVCGYPTTAEICSFCRLKKKIESHKS